jgi:hypothetical protein
MPQPIQRRISDWFTRYNMTIHPLQERPDQPEGEVVYLVKDCFTTRNGELESSDAPGAIPQWAQDAYVNPTFLEAGSRQHLFAHVIGLDGQASTGQEIRYWSDGFAKLGDPQYNDYVRVVTKESSGWANQYITSGSAFDPAQGQSGPWCWAPTGAAEVVSGGGLPNNEPIATFVVWQAVRRADLDPEAGGPDQPPPEPPEPPVKPPPIEPPPVEPPNKPPQPPTLTRRLGDWVERLNLRVRTLAERPDMPTGEVLYLVKDIFTTRDGSWEGSDQFGSVNQWAREAYLKPFGAPDYFDDAGADHHLFAAIIGLDGQLMRDQPIIFWSDGFEKLGDVSYNEYVMRQTKSHSGWANIVTGPGANYVPERGEMGPWCWAPVGAAEVVCGGGMPAKQHVSMFVVWQAVRRVDVEKPLPPPPAGGGDQGHEQGGDQKIFLPFVANAALAQASSLPLGLDTPLDLALLRTAVWNRLGIEYRPDSTLADYARRNALGMPVTQEFMVGRVLVQGFHGAIVYAPVDEPTAVHHVSW